MMNNNNNTGQFQEAPTTQLSTFGGGMRPPNMQQTATIQENIYGNMNQYQGQMQVAGGIEDDQNFQDNENQIQDKFREYRREIDDIKTCPDSGQAPGSKEYTKQVEKLMDQFKSQKLPLARIKKIMKSDEEVRMISAEAPILFAKACEMFITEITIKGYLNAEKSERKTLQRKDVAVAIARTETYDFLIDTIPKNELFQHVPQEQFTPYQNSLLERKAMIFGEANSQGVAPVGGSNEVEVSHGQPAEAHMHQQGQEPYHMINNQQINQQHAQQQMQQNQYNQFQQEEDDEQQDPDGTEPI